MKTVGMKVASFAAAASLLAVSACSGGGSGSSSETYLRYGHDLSAQFTNTFDVSKSKGDCDQLPMAFIYDNLLTLNRANNELQPSLADSWTVEGTDKRTITLKLHPGVKFTDGTPVDADAVKKGLEKNNTNDQLTSLDSIKTIDVVDPSTVRLNLKDDQSTPLLYALASSRDGMIMSPKSFATAGTKPVGSGPFEFESFEPGKEIRLKKNPDYWRKGVYDFPGIAFTQVGTGPPAVTALRANNVDMIRFEPESYDTLKSDSDVDVVVQPTAAYLQLQFRIKYKDPNKKSPFENKLVRQAVRYAINTAEINKLVQHDLGKIANQSLPSDSPGYNPDVANEYPYNPDKAKELLKEAGYPNGFTFEMAIPGPGIKNMADQGQLIQDQLKKVGITAKIKPIPGSDIASTYYIGQEGDAFAAERLRSTFYPGQYYDQWGKFQFVAIWNGAERADIDDLALRAQAAEDANVTADLTKQAAKIAVDEALEVPIAFAPQFLAYSKARVGGTVGGQPDICDPPDLSKMVMKKGG
jgi:peptide/nickel transport system substrate-binding protein